MSPPAATTVRPPLRFVLRIAGSIASVDADAWDACAGTDNPTASHAFLKAMEDTGCVGGRSGWQPQHVLLEEKAEGGGTRLIGAAPMYVKAHSYGEYVFDWGWAQAYERAGGRYYPKLQVAVPFTPVPGPRLLVRPGPQTEAVREALIRGLVEVARQCDVSSLHVTFPHAEDAQHLAAAGLMQRLGFQFHWTNRGYRTFDDFLADLSSRKRKQIRRERRDAVADGIVMRALTGAEIEPRHWDAFFRFYMDTGSRKWGSPYLNRRFFHRLGETMGERVLLVMAEKDGRPVAGALNLIGRDTLYGRNWGCIGDFRFLHFETCYYQAIDWAIAHGLARVEAGAQGEHKLQRGYLPVPTYSAHWIRDPRLAAAVEDFLRRERPAIEHEMRLLAAQGPFRQDGEAAEAPSSA
ncbi:MAG: N-acetyltransferase [Rhodospirillaceae bacterium]|nr:N-acetyltransferase [Rhodospirillaceae bacterium]